MSERWRCKDCKQEFKSYEETAQHVKLIHQRKPVDKTVSSTLGMLDDLEQLIKRAKK